MRSEFLLDPEVVFLNHGSYGACPRPVFERYQAWQRELERQPVEFLGRRLPGLLAEARSRLARFMGAHPDDLVFVPNDRTRAVFVSHVTSETALVLPVEAIVRRAREAGLTTIVDGAHAPAQVPLDLDELDVDYYAGNCHKWMCAPKGTGFLHVRRELQDTVGALIVSWGFGEEASFLTRNERQGTRDPSAYLAVAAAIDWLEGHDPPRMQQRARTLTRDGRRRLCELDGVPVFARKTEPLLRFSVAPYTEESDLDALLAALPDLLRAAS